MMTNDQIVALFASIGACASALATVWTVREMAKQRTMSYRPELAVSRSHITASQEGENGLPIKWEGYSTGSAGTTSRNPAALAVSNVGLGAAKDLRFVWSFDIVEAVATVNELAAHGSLSVQMRNEKFGGLSFASKTVMSQTSMWQNQQRVFLDYLLPASSESDSMDLEIPHAYRLAISALVFVWGQLEHKRDFPKLPSLGVTVGYADIADVQHNVTFVIEAELQIVKGKGESFEAIFLPKRSPA
jgi:hypothetical protein